MTAGDGWNGRFFETDSRFWPIARAAVRFAAHTDFPAPEELSLPNVKFVSAIKPRRVRRRARAPSDGYDQRILRGEVPTRPCSWHDFLNALVWATFPTSKRALHMLQAAAVERARAGGPGALPNGRARDHDALALLDEGGVVVLTAADGETLSLGFGHALYESLVRGLPAPTAGCLTFSVGALPDLAQATALADRLLAARLAEPLLPEDLSRVAF
jgi:hypothetical protein